MLELPHSADCLVCGRNNPLGMRLYLFVDDATGQVRCDYVPKPEHVGFEGIIHGGAIATIIDEAMVWAATWRGRRFCVCGELTVRYRQSLHVSQQVSIIAQVETSRPKLVETTAKVLDSKNTLLATASGKFVPVAPEQHTAFMASMLDEESTRDAIEKLR